MKVTAQVLGGELDVLELAEGATVGEVKEVMGVPTYTATVNGEPQDDDFELADFEFCTLSPSVKGGC